MNLPGGKLERQRRCPGLALGGVGAGAQAVQQNLHIILVRTGEALAAGHLRVVVLPLVLQQLDHKKLVVPEGIGHSFDRLVLNRKLLPAAGALAVGRGGAGGKHLDKA